MDKINNMFIVINKKRLCEVLPSTAKILDDAFEKFERCYKLETGKELDQKYIVCNQDEPYAEKVWNAILEGEDAKSQPPETLGRRALIHMTKEELEEFSTKFGYYNDHNVIEICLIQWQLYIRFGRIDGFSEKEKITHQDEIIWLYKKGFYIGVDD